MTSPRLPTNIAVSAMTLVTACGVASGAIGARFLWARSGANLRTEVSYEDYFRTIENEPTRLRDADRRARREYHRRQDNNKPDFNLDRDYERLRWKRDLELKAQTSCVLLLGVGIGCTAIFGWVFISEIETPFLDEVTPRIRNLVAGFVWPILIGVLSGFIPSVWPNLVAVIAFAWMVVMGVGGPRPSFVSTYKDVIPQADLQLYYDRRLRTWFCEHPEAWLLCFVAVGCLTTSIVYTGRAALAACWEVHPAAHSGMLMFIWILPFTLFHLCVYAMTAPAAWAEALTSVLIPPPESMKPRPAPIPDWVAHEQHVRAARGGVEILPARKLGEAQNP